jgi:hypothetical protein
MLKKRLFPFILCFMVVACGHGSDPGDPEVAKIKWAVTSGMVDSAKSGGVFPPDTPKAEMDRYGKYDFVLLEEPKVSGETATVKVRVRTKKDEAVGDAEWTFVRQEGTWRVKSAPLPEKAK